MAALFPGKNGSQEMAWQRETSAANPARRNDFSPEWHSGAYIAEIKKILRSYGLPEELAYLAPCRILFQYRAYSRIGAAGLWQFTGRPENNT